MGISLYGLTPATTYDALIKTGDNEPLTASLKVLSDGVGTNLPMEASTTAINFTGALQQSGVAVPTAGQVAAKQDLLVSGTNIKTINSTSLLGSGNIAVVTSPSGVAGAIQFSNGSAFASDATNLFWDDTNNRLGIGTNAPTSPLNIKGVTNTGTILLSLENSTRKIIDINDRGAITANAFNSSNQVFSLGYYGSFDAGGLILNGSSNANGVLLAGASGVDNYILNNLGLGTITPGARLGIKGSGSTSATTSLLVQNSAGTELFRVRDDQQTIMRGTVTLLGLFNNDYISIGLNRIYGMSIGQGALTFNANNISYSDTGSVVGVASSCFNIDSTTRGFLPPRMTTTQKNAIATPAAGLVLYDATTNKLQCYNGTTWNDLF